VTRGIKLNNPGNIEIGAPWQGLMPRSEMNAYQLAEKRFCVFRTPPDGIRAMAVVLNTYQDKRTAKDGSRIDTVREIIERWAPSVENDTGSYASHIRSLLGVMPGTVINVHDYYTAKPLVEGIILHENGVQPYTDAQIDLGLSMAGIRPPAKSLQQSRTVKGGQLAAAGGAVSIIGAVAEQVEAAAPIVQAIKLWGPWVAGSLALVAAGVVIYARWDDLRRLGR
jgi:hypothetical protein